MKKLALTFAIVLGITIGAFAQGGLFQYGAVSDEEYYGSAMVNDRTTPGLFPLLPDQHGLTTSEAAPLGSGAALLIGLGAAYAAAKRRKE